MRWPRWWTVSYPRINLTKLLSEVDERERSTAGEMASNAPNPLIPGITNTESRVEWVLLRRHATRGQIDPTFMRRFRTVDLEYLAGWGEMNPTQISDGESKSQEVKVVENAVRATRELQRRATMRSAMSMTFIAAVVGVLAGALATAVLS